MELFNEGGLKDEGGSVDPVSGNDVPIGSTKEEVRDDIPAMVSEGEFVFPADVVRYIGLNNLMQLRQDAKMGLKKMEAMGQMGNSEEATLPDDMPFDMADLVIIEGSDEPKEMAQGGVIKAQTGTFVVPKFDPRNQDVRQYKNAAGEIRNIPFYNGKPAYPIPVGFFPVGTDIPTEEDVKKEEPTTTRDRDPRPTPEPSEFQKAGGWDMDFGDPPDPKKVDLWTAEAKKTTGNGPMIMTGVAAIFGGVPAAFVHAANKFNAKGRDANMQRAIEAAKKTPKAGQVAALNEIVTSIDEGADETILGKLSGAVKELFGVSDEEAEKVQKVATNSGAVAKSLRPKARPEEKIEERTASQQMIDAGFTGREDAPFITPTEPTESDVTLEAFVETDNTLQQNLSELGLEDVDIASEPIGEKTFPDSTAEPPASNISNTLNVGVDGRLPDISTDLKTADITAAEAQTPEAFKEPNTVPLRTSIQTNKVKESLKDNELYNKLVNDLESNTKPLEVALAEINPEASKTLADLEPKGLGLGLDKESPATIKTVAEQYAEMLSPVRSNAGDTKDKDDGPEVPIMSSIINDTPTVSDIESYLEKVAQEETQQQQQDDDDDDPTPTTAQQAASQALSDFDQNVAEVQAAAGPNANQESIASEASAVQEKLEQIEKGITTGFKKGGLASRKKK